MGSILKASAAGSFYPAEPEKLRFDLNRMLTDTVRQDFKTEKKPAALIVPHAGYVYSGVQAAKAYAHIMSRNYSVVCVISPSHTVFFSFLSIYSGAALETPLADVPVHSESRNRVSHLPGIQLSKKAYSGEHALEVQLPFLSYCLKEFSLLPVIMGDQSPGQVKNASEMIRSLKDHYGRDILFVVSSDLSHFHSAEDAAVKDAKFMELCRQRDAENLLEHLEAGEVEACGGGPVAALLTAFNSKEYDYLDLGYSHSGQINGDNTTVVGYTSAIMTESDRI